MDPKAAPTPRSVVAHLWRRAGGAVLLSTLLIGALVLAPSWYMMEVYDRVVASRSVSTLVMLSVGAAGLIGLLCLLEWHRAEVLRELGDALDEALSDRAAAQAFERVRQQGPQAGQQALGSLQTLRGFVASPALTGLLDAPVASVFLALLWLLHPLLCGVALGAAVLQLVSAWWLDRQQADALRQGGQCASGAQATAERAFEQASSLQALGMFAAMTQRWGRQQHQAAALLLSAARRQAGHQAFSRWLQQAVGSALLGVACALLLAQELQGGAGMLIIASLLGGRVVAPLVQLVTHGASFFQARDAWRALCELLPESAAEVPAMSLPAPRGRLVVEQLVVAAGPSGRNAPLLRGLGFELAAGETLVVLGHSGAGKSTLARALVGLLSPAAGSVRLDGVEVSVWPRDELGPRIGYLPQQVALLDGSLADNVSRFSGADDALLHQALSDAGLLAFVQGLPAGLRTPLGIGGAWLSGGWRQRVGLARALYGRPAFVVLDEPNASLDRAGDAALEQALRELKARGCTVVVMSHRASVVGLADRLLVLREGQQLAFGPREEVLAALRQAGSRPPADAPPTAAAPVIKTLAAPQALTAS